MKELGVLLKKVANLCGNNINRLPSASTVNRIVDSKLAASQKQLGSLLKDKASTTLYTDERRKYGKCMQTYILTDEEQNSYILGLREMVNKKWTIKNTL